MSEFDPELNELMKEVASEMADSFKQNEEKFENNLKKFETIQQKLYSFVERQCQKEIEWLNNNKQNNSQEFESHLKEFEKCAGENDLGFSNFVKDMQDEQKTFYLNEMNCVMDCKKNNNNKSDIKNCLKKCLITSTEKYYSLYDRVDARMNEINSKI